ncbi:hypothetical protein QFZ79_002984 [Arthrobacter sp. V4I6]|nr:hypothetical protein [Arthrobacter sp. V1I7]MDQ0854873.1 hypothetical protein [Arthrobacter sp. V4I6]
MLRKSECSCPAWRSVLTISDGVRTPRRPAAYQARTVTIGDLWLTFFSFRGDAGQLELEAYIFGMITISIPDEEFPAAAVSEPQDK